jgi:Protein of unknown function (DUF1552)
MLAGIPVLESLRARAVPPASVPRRLLVLFTPNGTIADEFFARSADGTPRLGRILEPLEPFRSQLLLLDGFSMGVTALGPGNEHQRGMAAWLTGHPNNAGDFCGGDACGSGRSGWATGASLDQLVAQRRAGNTPLASLELGVRIEGSNNRHRMSFAGPELPVAPDADPRSVYRRLFGQSATQLEEQICVADRLAQQYRHLSNRVSAGDRQRLQAHLAAIDDIEHRLRALGSAGQCDAQPLEPPQLDIGDAARYAELTRLQSDLLIAAFRCDSTRVASLMWSGATAKVLPVWLNGRSYPQFSFRTPLSAAFHSYTHEPYGDQNDQKQAEVRNKLLSIYRWYAEAVAHLLGSLQAVTEADGSTLLDNTVVLWGSELASPDVHSFDRMPFLLAGGAKFLRTGRYIDYHAEQHTALLATVGLALGLPDARFGHPDFARAPLYELLRL